MANIGATENDSEIKLFPFLRVYKVIIGSIQNSFTEITPASWTENCLSLLQHKNIHQVWDKYAPKHKK